MSSLNAEIKTAIDSFDMDKARELLRDALKEADTETYYLASLAAIDDRQRKQFLEKALELDPFHAEAYKAVNGEPEAPASTEQPTAIVEAPEQAITTNEPEQPSDEIIVEENAVFVTGTVSADAEDFNIYIIPHTEGTVRTTVRKGAELRVFERGDFDEWYYVEYTSTIGQPVYGWIQAASIEDLQIDGEAVNSTDLPITEFRQNIRDDVLQLIELRTKDQHVALIAANLLSLEIASSEAAPAMVKAGLTKYNASGVAEQKFEELKQKTINLPDISVVTNDLIRVTESGLDQLDKHREEELREPKFKLNNAGYAVIIVFSVIWVFLFLIDEDAYIFVAVTLVFLMPLLHFLTPLKIWKKIQREEAVVQDAIKKQRHFIQEAISKIKTHVSNAEKLEKQLPKLQRIEQDKRSEYEIWKEELEAAEQKRKMSEEEEREFQREILRQQRNNELLNTGASVLGGVATRMVQDRKKVTFNYESDKKKKK